MLTQTTEYALRAVTFLARQARRGKQITQGTHADSGKTWKSGIVKEAVSEPICVRRLNLDGDEQADLVHHGGPNKAVLA